MTFLIGFYDDRKNLVDLDEFGCYLSVLLEGARPPEEGYWFADQEKVFQDMEDWWETLKRYIETVIKRGLALNLLEEILAE